MRFERDVIAETVAEPWEGDKTEMWVSEQKKNDVIYMTVMDTQPG